MVISRAAVAALASNLLVGGGYIAAAEETSSCRCPADENVRIGGVSHGNVADSFWDPIYAAAERAAIDSKVELNFLRSDESSQTAQGGQNLTYWMVERIKEMCSGDNVVDGFFSTINDQAVLTALQSNCLANGIPTIVINAGLTMAQDASGNISSNKFLNYIGTDDYQTGEASGTKLLSACPDCKRFYCLDHCGGCTSWVERCRGFGDAVGEGYGQRIPIDDSSEDAYIASVESVIGTNGTWNDVGILAGTQKSLVLLLEALHNKQPGFKIAGIDTSPELYKVLGDGKWLWGTSQEPYLQGYYPVQLLANTVRMGGQGLQTFNLATGPRFVTEAPAGAQLCYFDVDPFKSCVDDTQNETSETTTSPPSDTSEPSPGTRKLVSATTMLVSAALRIFGI